MPEELFQVYPGEFNRATSVHLAHAVHAISVQVTSPTVILTLSVPRGFMRRRLYLRPARITEGLSQSFPDRADKNRGRLEFFRGTEKIGELPYSHNGLTDGVSGAGVSGVLCNTYSVSIGGVSFYDYTGSSGAGLAEGVENNIVFHIRSTNDSLGGSKRVFVPVSLDLRLDFDKLVATLENPVSSGTNTGAEVLCWCVACLSTPEGL